METLEELKNLFYKEHIRDRRLTLINYALILCVVVLIVGALIYIGADIKGFLSGFINQGGDDKSLTNIYHIITPITVFVCIIGYPFYLIWKVSKRPKKIEELIGRAEKGARLATIHEHIEYKITIPLLKVNFKLCPVTFVQVFLHGDAKPYILPIRKAYIPDMKLLLSGANVQEINQHKNDLYGNAAISTEDGNFTPTPIKSVDEFRTFMDTELKEDITALESSRKSIHRMIVLGSVFAGILIVGIMGYIFYKSFTIDVETASEFNPLTTIVPIFVLGFAITIIFNIVAKKKHAKTPIDETASFDTNSFKEKIVTKMVHFINPSVKYIPIAHLALEDIFESGLFQQRNYTLDGSDQISGRHNGVPFISCDLSLYFKKNWSEEKESPDCAFFGQFFVARFNKNFSTPVYIIPKKNKYDTLGYLISNKGETVKLEDPEFMKMFSVYAQDQIEARYILTPSLMERLKELAKRSKGEFYITFYNNKITVANNSGINNFEVGYSKSMSKKDNELLIGFYNDLCNQFAIIDELKLNINIWKK